MNAKSNRLVSKKEARIITCVSRTEQWRLERYGMYPKARLIPGTKKTGYLLYELLEWVENLPYAVSVSDGINNRS